MCVRDVLILCFSLGIYIHVSVVFVYMSFNEIIEYSNFI